MRNTPEVGKRPTSNRRSRPGRDRKLGWRRILLLSSLAVFLIVGFVAAAIYYKLDDALDQVTNDPYEIGTSDQPKKETPYEPKKPLSILILGLDKRSQTGSLNTDVMIVATVNPETKRVTMVSLPRDTRVKIPGYRGYEKINAVFAIGESERRRAERSGQPVTENGITLLNKTLQEMLGIPITNYIEIDFEGFKAIIDELGGIEINVERSMVYRDPTDGTNINLKPGLQTLNGKQALDYVRHRQDSRGPSYYSSDYERNQRQQEVIKKVIDKIVSLEGITKIFNVVDTGAKHVNTNLTKSQIKGLVYDFKDFRSDNMIVLDNGAVWKYPYTFWPKENMTTIRNTLQKEMGITGVVALNDAAIAENYKPETVSNSKPASAPPAAPEADPKPPTEETKPTNPEPEQPAQPDPLNPEEPIIPADPTIPPPDIVNPVTPPDTVEPDAGWEQPPIHNTPPPDIEPLPQTTAPPPVPDTGTMEQSA